MSTLAPELSLVSSDPITIAPDVLASLNPRQRTAAEVTRGPVAIVAGAGTGKTTTITHRIAHQVLSGAVQPREILAVTFTAKAAGVLRERLARLGVRGVEARTFHSAALWQLGVLHQQYTGRPLERLLSSKARLLRPIVGRLPAPFKFRPIREFAGEIEWAKNQLVTRDEYAEAADRLDRDCPVPADILDRVWRGYEEALAREGALDFEDLIGRCADLLTQVPEAGARIRGRFTSFTVDEYQDVNPLQQRLLDAWLGDRSDVCVVGDDYQTVYGFTGANPQYLLGFADRFPGAHVVRLEDNYRSTAQVLDLANRLVPLLGGFEKRLVAHRPDGPVPEVHRPADPAAEASLVARHVQRLLDGGMPGSEIAVLYRTNVKSEAFEAAFARAGIPFQVRDGSFLQRAAARAVVERMERTAALPVVSGVASILRELGYDPDADHGGEERARQDDMAQLALLAGEFAVATERAGSEGSTRAFAADLRARFSAESDVSGVQLMTLHRSKGLEFDAVFLIGLTDGELPYKHRGTAADVVEERRLLYVGITRARTELHLTASLSGKPSRFLAELGLITAAAAASAGTGAKRSGSAIAELEGPAAELAQTLRAWRTDRSKTDEVPAYVVFADATLAAIATNRPTTLEALAQISGVGPSKLEKYGADVIALLNAEA